MTETFPKILKSPQHPEYIPDGNYQQPKRRFTFQLQMSQFTSPEYLRSLDILMKYPQLKTVPIVKDSIGSAIVNIAAHTRVHTELSGWSDAILSCVSDYCMMFCIFKELHEVSAPLSEYLEHEIFGFIYHITNTAHQSLLNNKFNNSTPEKYLEYKKSHLIDVEVRNANIEIEFNRYHISKLVQYYFIVEMTAYAFKNTIEDNHCEELHIWYDEAMRLVLDSINYGDQSLSLSAGITYWDTQFVEEYLTKLIRITSNSSTYYTELQEELDLLDEDFTYHERLAIGKLLPLTFFEGQRIYKRVIQNLLWSRLVVLRPDSKLYKPYSID